MTSEHYDVLVVGGGAAGVAAAVGAAREGARTLLVERFGFLGGAATNANVLAYCGFWTQRDPPRMGVRGVGAEVLNELHHLGLDVTPLRTPTENWIVALDPEAVKLALDRVAGRHGVDCLLHSRVVEAECAEGRVQAVVVADHAGMREITADAFVDASGQADLVALAGGDVSIPPDEVRQAASFPVRFGGIPAGIVIDRAAVREAIARLDGEEPGIRVRPEGGMFFRLPISADIWWLGIDVLTDGLNGASLTRAEIAGRAMAWRAQQAFKDAVPGFAGAYISGTGPQVGIRAARTATPRLHLRAEAMLAGQLTDDGVALGCWPAEVHHGLSGARYDRIGGDGSYHVPYDAIRAAAFDNVWLGGRAIGCDPLVYGSLRVMGTAFATGHAAGVAAACSVQTGRENGVAEVRAALLRQGAII
jgi:glycine/D-amino acid oxidase-like deaminating enzyme